MNILDYLFVDNFPHLLVLALIVFVAGIIRGCIGFGFSALVVASTSFWIDVKFTVIMVVFMEIIASLSMVNNVKESVDFTLLKTLSIGGFFALFAGVWVLVTVSSNWHQTLMSIYLFVVASIALLRFEFKKPVTQMRLFITGTIAGFYSGLAALGGIFIATMLSSSRFPIKDIRATMVVYFLLTEAVFLTAAYVNDLVTREVIYTSLLLSLPMLIGIVFGSKLFAALPEKTLKQMVLICILLLSIVGLVKTLA